MQTKKLSSFMLYIFDPSSKHCLFLRERQEVLCFGEWVKSVALIACISENCA
jgi:GTP1/Obg family GTP-binding protein